MQPVVEPTAFALALALVLGLLVGSFLNVVVWRLPRGESVVSPGSHCPACDAAIPGSRKKPALNVVPVAIAYTLKRPSSFFSLFFFRTGAILTSLHKRADTKGDKA